MSLRPRSPDLFAATLACALVSAAVGPVRGQEHVADVDPGAGVVLPTGDLSDLYDPGVAAEIGVSRRISGPLRAAVDFDLGALPGKDFAGGEIPDLRVWSFTGGLELDLLDRTSSPWRVTPEVTGGLVRFDSDDVAVPGDGDFSGNDLGETYATAAGALRIGRSLSDRIGLFVAGTAQVFFADEEDTAIFREVDPDAPAFGTTVAVPVTAGIRIQF